GDAGLLVGHDHVAEGAGYRDAQVYRYWYRGHYPGRCLIRTGCLSSGSFNEKALSARAERANSQQNDPSGLSRTAMAFVEVRNIGRDFPGVTALDDVELDLELGRVHILAGENGAGKSTLVKLLTGADTPSRGSIRIDGRDTAEHPEVF